MVGGGAAPVSDLTGLKMSVLRVHKARGNRDGREGEWIVGVNTGSGGDAGRRI